MIIAKTMKNGKRKITSDYFDEVKLYREMMKDCFETLGNKGAAIYHRKPEDVARVKKVQLTAVVQQMIASKRGCWEVAEYIKQYKGDLRDIVPDYGPAKPCEDYDDMTKELQELEAVQFKTEDQISRIDELRKTIQKWDEFVENNLHNEAALHS